MIKKCLICTKEFETFACKIAQGRGKYCSRKCYEISKQGKPSWNKGKSNTWMIGNQYRKGVPNTNPNRMFGEDNHKWKGDQVGIQHSICGFTESLGNQTSAIFAEIIQIEDMSGR